jgi:hypothetical protein
VLDWDEMIAKKRKKEDARIKMARRLANLDSISTQSQDIVPSSTVSKGLSMVLGKMVSEVLVH